MSAFCCICKEDFPVAEEPASWRMGLLRPLAFAPRPLVAQFREWLNHDEGSFLCGNCCFDYRDQEDA